MHCPKILVRTLFVFILLAGLVAGILLSSLASVRAEPQMQLATHMVISQVYGGGGNSNAIYQNDYIELFNPTNITVSLSGWSIQYAPGTGTKLFSANVTDLSGSLASGQYYLVQLASSGSVGSVLPKPDVTGTTNMNATAGKVILVNTTTGLPCNGGSSSSTPCTASDLASIIDLVGYGTTSTVDYFEGSNPAPSPSNTTSDIRTVNGCYDLDNNKTDFVTGAPNPRNTGSSITSCGDLFTETASAVNLTSTASALTATASAVKPYSHCFGCKSYRYGNGSHCNSLLC